MHNIDLTPPGVAAPATAARPLAAARAEVLAELNRHRADGGLPPLALDDALNAAAQARAEAVAAAPDLTALEARTKDIGPRVQAAGYDHRLVSEIVLWGEAPFGSRWSALRQAEPSLAADAMQSEYRDLGVGAAQGLDGFVRVLIFGFSRKDDFASRTAALSDLTAVRAQLLARVNEERKAARLPPLHESVLLDQAAQAHAEDMIRRSFYGHESPERTTALARAGRVGYEGATIAENVAEGQSSVREVVDGWMASPVHRDHILSFVLKEIGIGMAFGKNARGYEIVWVQMFGAPVR